MVASAVGGIPEVVTDGVDGLLVPPGRPRRARGCGRPACSRIPRCRQRLGEAGYRTVAERFSIDAQVRRIEELYDEELARAGVVSAIPQEPMPVGAPDGRAALEVPPL